MKTKIFKPAGATVGSKQTGNWTDVNTWLLGGLPTILDNVIINSGHTVTIPTGQNVSAGSLFDKGILRNFGILQMGNLKPNAAGTDLENISFSHHIRGGFRGINLDASNNLTNKIFSLKLGYEESGFYDGNIGKQEFKNSLDNVSRSFTYGYDGASRITGGTYAGTGTENYSLNSVSYDLNGNIKTLSRNGLKSNNSFGLIDNLTYSYQNNSNKIQKVDDTSNETASFKDVSGNDYTYSLDGSLTSDANKGITSIEYNYLKKPRRIIQNGVEIMYQYDALGKKLKETIGSNVTDHNGNTIYKNGALYQISHDEGRIINGEYEYNIKDHLGNLRVAFRDSLGVAKITQSNAYGIFGEILPTLNYLKPLWKEDNFKFTGKEYLPETGYTDFGARFYDNIVPRFISIDPLSELNTRFSPTVYGNNNPIMFTDPDGMKSVWNGQYGENSGYSDDKTGESRSWSDVQGEYGFGGDDKDKGKGDKSKNQISNYVNFNLNKLKNFANGLSNSLFEAKNTNLIIYGNGKASDNFFSGEFKKGGKSVVMDLGKDNQVFWLMTFFAPSRQIDDKGISNLIDLFGDNHPIYSDKNFSKSGQYEGLFYELSKLKYVGAANGYTRYDGNFYLPVSTYNQATTEYKYFLIGISEKQAKSGIYKEILTKYK